MIYIRGFMACRRSGYGSPLFQWLWFLQCNMDFLYCPQSYHICNRFQQRCETQVPLWYIFTLCLSYEWPAWFIKRNTPPTNVDIIINHCGFRTQCHSLLSSKISCPQILRNIWAVRYGFKVIKSLGYLTITSKSLLPNSISNCKVIQLFQYTILRLWDFTTHCGKTSSHLVMEVGNRGPGLETTQSNFLAWRSYIFVGRINCNQYSMEIVQ